MTHFARVSPRPVEVLDRVEKFAPAARGLATSNCVFVIPPRVKTKRGAPVTSHKDKIDLLVAALNDVKPAWTTIEHPRRRITREQDIDMHGNPYEPSMVSPDFLHYHITTVGTVTATFAQAHRMYLQEPTAAKVSLTEALRRGGTDTRYANPRTYQQVEIKPDDALVFRLSEEQSGLPFLHDFTTTSTWRMAEITAIYRLD